MTTRVGHVEDGADLETARRDFIEAARTLMAARGTCDISVTDVVRRSRLHNAAFYRIFGSKDGLLLAVAEDAVHRIATLLATGVSRAPDPPTAVRAWASMLLHHAASHGATATPFLLDRHRLMHGFPDTEESMTRPIRSVLHDVLRAAGRPDAEAAGDAATELVFAQQATWLARGHRPTDAEIEQVATFIVRLVGVPDTEEHGASDHVNQPRP